MKTYTMMIRAPISRLFGWRQSLSFTCQAENRDHAIRLATLRATNDGITPKPDLVIDSLREGY